jgi:geranylgeranyl diphosphate synthase type II
MKADFLDILGKTREVVWPVVNKYIEKSLEFPKYCRIDEKYQELVEFQRKLISEYPNRKGKYLRPTLLLSTALAMGVPVDLAILPAAAMQLSEDWILIHDDIEDNSEQRRGFPALQKIYGLELAINAGDALQVVMWKMVGDTNNKKIVDEFYQILNRTTFGQTIEIKWNQENKLDITDEDVLLIMESKTGYYTIAGPMRLGAILAGATDEELKIIYNFGVNLGRAFQIIDDVLDITSDFLGQKKQQYNDIYEGKRTILLSRLLRSVNSEELKEVASILSKKREQKSTEEVLLVVEMMKKYKSVDYARSLAVTFSVEAKKILKEQMPFIKVEPYRQQLEGAIDFVVNREH